MPTRPPARWTPLHLRLVTPAFVGQPTAGPQMFPVSSLRGVLRYWVRALAGAHIGGDLTALARAENAVLGAATDDTAQPSPILLRPAQPVTYEPPDAAHTWLPGTASSAPTGYLLGQGLYDAGAKKLLRPFLPPRTDLPLRVKNLAGRHEWTLFLAALWALRTFGGIGARTRRGFGTITVYNAHTLPDAPDWLTRDQDQDLPHVLHAVGEALDALKITPAEPPDRTQRPTYPSFDLGHPPDWYYHLDTPLHATTGGTALAEIGRALRSFRLATATDRNNSNRPLSGEEPRNSADYRDITKPYLDTGRTAHTQPINAALGLPINYSDPVPSGRPDQRRTAVIEPLAPAPSSPATPAAPRTGPPSPMAVAAAHARRPATATVLRRASPLWLRVHHHDDAWHVRSLAFYAELLPTGATLRIRDTTSEDNGHTRRSPTPVPSPTGSLVDDVLYAWTGWIQDF